MSVPTNAYGNFAFSALTANALRSPDQVAISFCGTTSITYADLDARVNRTGNALLEAGIQPGTRTATLLGDTLNVVDVYLAETKIGTTVAAINPYWTEDVMVAVTKRSEAKAFVYDSHFDEVVARLRPELPEVELWVSLDGDGTDAVDLRPLLERASEESPPLRGFFGDEWMLLYTSGYTGLPKAVSHTHASGMAAANIWTDLPSGQGSVIGAGPIIWGSGFPSVVGTGFFGGMRLALENDFAPKNAIHVIERERITHIVVLPSFWTDILSDDSHRDVDLSSLRVVILGSEPILPSLLERIKERVPDVELHTFYGCSEAPYTTLGRLDDGSQDVTQAGRARAMCSVKVIDERGERVWGELGTLCHAGPHVFQGYVNQPEVTAKALRDGWYVGEDLGIQDRDGLVTVMGRRADAIRRAGAWIHPGQVEDGALSLAAVAEAGAVGVPEGVDDQRILLAVSPKADRRDLTEDDVWAHLRATLPDSLVPDAVVVADELPHNQQAAAGTGKLLRHEIRERWGDRLRQG